MSGAAARLHAVGDPAQGAESATGFPLTDLGNAERLVALHGDAMRFVPGLGWHVWDGGRWRVDDTGEVQRRAKHAARKRLHDAAECRDADDRKAIVKWASASESEPRLRAAVTLAQSEEPVVARPADLDRDSYLLNCANGTIDLRTGQLRVPTQADLITLATPVPYEPAAECPRWQRFLLEIFAGDIELVAFMHRLFGYALTGDTREEVLIVLHGAGCNGKSTLLAVIRRLLGEYASAASFETFMRARGDRGPRNDLARLHRARLVTAAESGEGRRLDEATIKEVTGRDTIAARFLYGEHFEFTPQFKLVLSTNHKPKVDGSDDALWRRLRLIPFTESFEGRRDKGLADTLEHEIAGILAWAVQGCLDWQQHGLGEPSAIKAATNEYRQDEDLLGAFLADHCQPDGEVPADQLRAAYTTYCEDAGEKPLPASTLGKQLSRRGIHKHKRTGTYRGISLR